SEFRDRYLLTRKFGNKFVEFYYQHSPPVADYLRQHPILKIAVRYALIPVTGAVYLTLTVHPEIWLMGFMLMLAGILFAGKRYNRLRRGA
ncbi:CFI-box-CTERM domain-containing protein, partial [Thermodesulfobacteriota bacterium]